MEYEDLVVSALPLCRQEARRWRHTPIDQEELVGEAALALVRAAKRFNPSFGVPFSKFARRAIKGALMDVVRTQARRESLGEGRFAEVTSLNKPVRDEREWEPAHPQSLEDLVEAREALRILAGIPAPERYVLIRTVIDGAPAAEVADELGVSRDRVYVLSSTGSLRLRLRLARAA